MPSNMKGRIVEVILTGICTALVLWSINNFRTDLDDKFRKTEERAKEIDKRAQRIEANYITKEDFNLILEAKLKQFKVNKEGRLIISTSGY